MIVYLLYYDYSYHYDYSGVPAAGLAIPPVCGDYGGNHHSAMSVEKEGIIKYDQSDFQFIPPLPGHEWITLERYRRRLNGMELISVYSDGLGYGNISMRMDYSAIHPTTQPQFLITGTQTGHLRNLSGEHYTRVIDFDIHRFAVRAQGCVRASSETATHAAIYQMNPDIRAIIHIHNLKIWQTLIALGYPSTGKWIPYGTLEMAIAVRECINYKSQGLIVMKGHHEGVIAYAPNLAAGMNAIAAVYKRFVNPSHRSD